jgi:hypothetical protein
MFGLVHMGPKTEEWPEKSGGSNGENDEVWDLGGLSDKPVGNLAEE